MDAQAGGVHERALAELRAGAKRSHWMWFEFPQLAGLGSSATARRYAIADLSEARDYLSDPLLGARLRDGCDALLAAPGDDPVTILGPVDALKLRSSMTLFARADPSESRFASVLARFYGGAGDPVTERLLAR